MTLDVRCIPIAILLHLSNASPLTCLHWSYGLHRERATAADSCEEANAERERAQRHPQKTQNGAEAVLAYTIIYRIDACWRGWEWRKMQKLFHVEYSKRGMLRVGSSLPGQRLNKFFSIFWPHCLYQGHWWRGVPFPCLEGSKMSDGWHPRNLLASL